MSTLTIEDLRRSGRPMVASCCECGHMATMAAAHLNALNVAPDTKIADVCSRIICAACGSKRVATFPMAWRLMRRLHW